MFAFLFCWHCVLLLLGPSIFLSCSIATPRAMPIHLEYITERICDACTTLEDEYNFVLECSLYLNIRKKNHTIIFLEKNYYI